MSTWTHVAGIVRFDVLAALGAAEPDLGKTVGYESPESAWDECTVPCGSEGSLNCEMWVNPDTCQIASRTAYIFGDLRDFDDADEIIEYFNRITKDKMVRNACFTFYVEGEKERQFTYIDKGFKETF